MNNITKMQSLFAVLIIVFSLTLYSCDKKEENTISSKDRQTCEGCHTDYAYLQEVFSPDTVAAAGGCGGDAPHYEPYDRVFMGGEGYEQYKATSHYKIGCVGCHNGVAKANNKNEAHSGDFVAHPSDIADIKCASCHKDIVDKFATSIHNGTGQKRKVSIRSGLTGPADFDKLPAHQIEGYNKNCKTCHGTCGNCHIVRPSAGGGGLAQGHSFAKTPDMVNVCVTCHTSRGGHAFMGVASGTEPDVHLSKKGFDCLSCHTGKELHGDGNKVEQRYAYAELPDCKKCHPSLDRKNRYHTVHYTDLDCQVCHSQDYNNCGSCHVHGQGARIPSYMSFKLAMNPIPDVKKGYKFALVRRTLAAPDNWKEYGVENYSNFNAFPTYNYTTPHNILRWTNRTKVETSQNCSDKCHIRKDGTSVMNKNLFLFKEDLLDWEKAATEKITVDGKLPSKWTY